MIRNETDPARIVVELTSPGGEFEIVEEDILGVRMPVFAHRPHSLGDLLASTPAPGSRDYLVTAHRRLSYDQHTDAVGALAHTLASRHGVTKGDRVGILAANSPEWIIAFWATVSLGAICVAYNAWWTTEEIAYGLDHAHAAPKLLIADAKRAARLPDAVSIPVLPVETDLSNLNTNTTTPSIVDINEDDPAVIVYTSGTSGKPKGATHSHRNLVATALYHRLMKATAAAFSPAAAGPGRWLLSMPLFHIASLHNVAIPRLATGETVVLTQGAFDPHRVLDLVSRAQVTNWTRGADDGASADRARRARGRPLRPVRAALVQSCLGAVGTRATGRGARPDPCCAIRPGQQLWPHRVLHWGDGGRPGGARGRSRHRWRAGPHRRGAGAGRVRRRAAGRH
jgi:acyl-CoA synthetase (AMP-forming)/AMP-acid ligase II